MWRPTLRPGERGFALLIVLWSVVLLALLAAGMTASGRTDVQLATNLRAAAAAEAAADGAVYEAAYRLREDVWPADGRPIAIARGGAAVTLCIRNESGKLNPNSTNIGLLAALFRELGFDSRAASRLAAAIYDWRSPGAEPSPDGAKAAQYRDAGLGYGPTGAPFDNLAQLGAVLGMTPALLREVSPYLSVWNDADPDPLTATAPVIRAIRDVAGADPLAVALPAAPRTVTVSALAETAQGGRFLRQATIRLGTGAEVPVTILTWSAEAGPLRPLCR